MVNTEQKYYWWTEDTCNKWWFAFEECETEEWKYTYFLGEIQMMELLYNEIFPGYTTDTHEWFTKKTMDELIKKGEELW